MRARSSLVDSALEAGDLDRRRAGTLLAGGIAFRVFLWLLPAALLFAGVAGVLRLSGASQPEKIAGTLGLSASVVNIVREATRQSDRGAAALIAIGVVLTLYASMSLVRASASRRFWPGSSRSAAGRICSATARSSRLRCSRRSRR